MSRFQRTALQFAQWGLGFGALVWALEDVDFALLWQAVRSYSVTAMLPVFFFIVADYLFMGRRLEVLLPRDIGFRHSLSATLLGTGMNCILPKSLNPHVSRLHAGLIDQVRLAWVAHGFVYSVATWAAYYLSFYFTIRYVGGLEMGAAEQLVVLTIATVGTAIPSLPGGIGLFEGAMVLSMSWYGIDGTTAMGLALFFHAVHFFPLALTALCIHSRASYVRDKEPEGSGAGEKSAKDGRSR